MAFPKFEIRLDVMPDAQVCDPQDCTDPFFTLDDMGHAQYEAELATLSSIVIDLCTCLTLVNGAWFRVRGLIEDQWYVNIACDLSDIIASIPGVLRTLKGTRDCRDSILFTEHRGGVVVECIREGTTIELRCGADYPAVHREKTETVRFVRMLEELLKDFVSAARTCCPWLTRHPVFEAWMETDVQPALDAPIA